MIGPRQPQRVVAAHAMPPDGAINLGVFQHVADVQGAGDVGRGNHEGKHGRPAFCIGIEYAGIDPPLCPVRLEPLRLVHFLKLHGEISI